MYAETGDQLVGQRLVGSYGELLGEVVGVLGDDGTPPYLVRWYDTGLETLDSPDDGTIWIRSKRRARTQMAVASAMERQARRGV